MPREAVRPTRLASGNESKGGRARRGGVGYLFLGVLLCACQPPARGAERTRHADAATQANARLGRHIPSITGQETLTYTVQLDDALTHLAIEACPHGFSLEGLNAPSPNAQALLEGSKIITPEGDVPCATENLDLPHLKPDECLRYTVIFPHQSPDPTAFRRVGRDLLASPDVWLWVATPRPLGVRMRARLELPAGVSAILPWPSARAAQDAPSTTSPAAASTTELEIPETAFAWKSGGGFVHSPSTRLAVPDTDLELATLGDGFPEHDAEVRAWLEEGARTSSLLFGAFPVPRAQVLAVPGDRSGAAFGMALRGGGPSVVILLDRHANASTLRDDWTCTHEFLHLGVPWLPPEDAWLFEGLATYYTELTRARAGLITPQQAMQHLLEGFARGRAGAGQYSLADDSAYMRPRHAFHRVYWSGAALALLTDVAARRAGGPTLDSALRAFAQCCASSDEEWTAERVLARLDASLGAPRFATQAHAWLGRRDFPELAATLRALGVALGPHGEALFTPAPDAPIRDALLAPDSHAHADGEPHQQ